MDATPYGVCIRSTQWVKPACCVPAGGSECVCEWDQHRGRSAGKGGAVPQAQARGAVQLLDHRASESTQSVSGCQLCGFAGCLGVCLPVSVCLLGDGPVLPVAATATGRCLQVRAECKVLTPPSQHAMCLCASPSAPCLLCSHAAGHCPSPIPHPTSA